MVRDPRFSNMLLHIVSDRLLVCFCFPCELFAQRVGKGSDRSKSYLAHLRQFRCLRMMKLRSCIVKLYLKQTNTI